MRRALTALLTTLTLLGGAPLGTAQASEVPFLLGPARPAAPANWPAGTCAAPTDPLEWAVWNVVTDGGHTPDLTCGNAFVGYLRTPATTGDAFDVTAAQIVAARREVLLASMEWRAGPGHPGWTFAQAVAELHRRVLADPAAYPDGMTVRLLLGGLPDLARSDGASQPLAVLRDLLSLGVPLDDPAVGWHLTLLNYRYFPHSHVKLHVIDGTDLTVAGYNYTDWHLPAGRQPDAHSLHDLGLRLTGPLAQSGVAAFDDLWRHSQALACPADVTPETAATRCTVSDPPPVSHPQAATLAVRTGDDRAYLLYRRSAGEDHADRALIALLDAAQHDIDLMQADFSPGLGCWYAYQNPDPCPPERWPVYLQAVLRAAERGVHVRVLMVDYGVGEVANRAGAALLHLELARRGLADRFEARYTTFNMHTKALTVDGRMVVAGSMNFHFSAWGNLGLAEADVATTDPRAVRQQQQSFQDAWIHGSRPVPPEWWYRNIDLPPGR